MAGVRQGKKVRRRKETKSMNTAASMGPIQLAAVTYVICAIISIGVAGIIKLLVGYINMQKKRTAAKAAAESGSPQ
jgi:hypothetical protein